PPHPASCRRAGEPPAARSGGECGLGWQGVILYPRNERDGSFQQSYSTSHSCDLSSPLESNRNEADRRENGINQNDTKNYFGHKDEILIRLSIPTRLSHLRMDPLKIQRTDRNRNQNLAQNHPRQSKKARHKKCKN